MADYVKNPVIDVYKRWSDSIKGIVGEGNYSMDASSKPASDKKYFARMLMMGAPGIRWNLDGSECATNPSFQVESYAQGYSAIEKAYSIDEKSHNAMVSMGFRRTYGPELITNADTAIKRVISRYTRLYTGDLLNE